MSTVESSPGSVSYRHEHHLANAARGAGWPFAHRYLLVMAAVLAGAAYLRLNLLAHKSFWFDEGFSVGIARLDWSNFLHLLWLREATWLCITGCSSYGSTSA